LRGVPREEFIEPDRIIPIKNFVKENKDADGNFQSLKTRGVGRGGRQYPTMYEAMSSPTASTQSLFTVATIGAHEGKRMASYDFPRAYLNASRIGRAPELFLKLNKFQTEVMTRVDPTWREYTLNDGTSRAEVTGALYGTIEPGALWNEDVKAVLESLGLTQSKYDQCVFLSKSMRIVLYVDDLFISYENDEDLDVIQNIIISEYGGEMKLPIDGVLEFLGTKFQLSDKGVSITIPAKISEVIEGIDRTCKTPAGPNLFTISEESSLPSERDKSKFHTITAKLLYISKRVRPDILLAVNFLTTRVQHPTEEDWAKLTRVLKYLKETEHLGLILRIGDKMVINVYIDASFGVHEMDGRSQTGACIGIGNALGIMTKSTKQ